MSRKPGIDPAYYDTHDFADDMAEAKKNGTLIITKPGESTIEAIRRHMQANKKTETVSVRLPKPLVVAINRQRAFLYLGLPILGGLLKLMLSLL